MCRGRSKQSKIPDNSPHSRSQSPNYRKKPAFKVNKNDNGCCHKNRRRVVYHSATKNIKKYQKTLTSVSYTHLDGTLDIALELFGQMAVHEDQIGHNLEMLQGLIDSEALMMRLAEIYGRMEAHELVYELAMAAIAQKRQLKELALADSRVTAHLTEEELENLMRPEHYTGLAEHFVDQVAGTE